MPHEYFGSTSRALIDRISENHRYFPSAIHGLDVMVKDSKRFGDTNNWGFFTFGHQDPPYEPTAKVMASTECAYCHIADVAKTDMVWVQFYPLLNAELH
jgi:hypothetical protein